MDYPRIVMAAKGSTDNIEIDSDRLVGVTGFYHRSNPIVETRIEGNLYGKSFYLDNRYDWIVGTDDQNTVVLVPLSR